MSTIATLNAGIDLAWADDEQSLPLSNAELPRSALDALETDARSNMIIDIPLSPQSNLLMELTHDGKVMELVARFELSTRDQDSDALQAHRHRTHVSANSEHISTESPPTARSVREKDVALATSKQPGLSPRKSIPYEWKKTTRPQAPVFQTERRQEAREIKRQNAIYLTKDAGEAVSKDITSPSAPSSPTKSSRSQSKTNLQSPSSSSTRSSPLRAATIMINATASPTRRPRLNVQTQAKAPSVAPSTISAHGTEYYSAHSTVSLIPSGPSSERSSHDSFHSAEEHAWGLPTSSQTGQPADNQHTIQSHAQSNNPSHPSLTSADWVGQTAGTRGSTSQLMSHSRSKTEPHATKLKLESAAPNLTLRIPNANSDLATRKSLLDPSLASGNSSSSPTKSLSRIPRVAPTYDTGTKASCMKRSQSTKSLKGKKDPDVSKSNRTTILLKDKGDQKGNLGGLVTANPLRQVKTLDSRVGTPIPRVPATVDEQPFVNSLVASFLEEVDPNAHPDHTPFTEDNASEASLGPYSSRNTSTSTIKAPKPNKTGYSSQKLIAKEGGFDPKKAKSNVADKDCIGAVESDFDSKNTRSEPLRHSYRYSGGGNRYKQQGRSRSAGAHSMLSKASSELRATAPEFIPQPQNELQASMQNPNVDDWAQHHNATIDLSALDNYGLPWFFYMYPIQMQQAIKTPSKHKNMPRGHKRGDTSLFPRKFEQLSSTDGHHTFTGRDVMRRDFAKNIVPFASQLDEIARNAAARYENKAKRESSPTRKGYMTMAPRSGRSLRQLGNGLYDNLSRNRFRAGMPIEASIPFPDPIPPSGGPQGHTTIGDMDTDSSVPKSNISYAVELTSEGCGSVNIERAAEWVGKACNICEPDH